MATPSANQRENRVPTPTPVKPPTVRGIPVAPTPAKSSNSSSSSKNAPTKQEIRALSEAFKEIKNAAEALGSGFTSGGTTGTTQGGESEEDRRRREELARQVALEKAKLEAEKARLQAEKQDAFALVEQTMRGYGFTDTELNEILNYIKKGLVDPKMGPNQLILELRQLPSYKLRFAGNETRRSKGLNALSEAEYLAQERDYSETLRRYGQQRLGSRSQFATLIGNDISNTELGSRVSMAVNRLSNANPAILTQLKTYYPTVNNSDIVAYFLAPSETLPELEAKVTTAEIGATAAQYGLASELTRISELQKYGVDLARARQGYENIAQVLPRTEILSDIYKQAGIDYNQTTAEQEEFKGLASAKRARNQLAQLEAAAFSGSAGLGRTSLTKNIGGAI